MQKMAVLLLWGVLFTATAFGQNNAEFRATWIVDTQWLSPDKSIEENKAEIRRILDNHKQANMTSVLWQVRRFGSVYYPSSIEPWGPQTNFADPGFDPLAYAIEQAHARGLELHAWFNTFESRHEYPGSPSQVHPEWICRDQDGNVMPSDIAWLSPGLPEVREHLKQVAMEIVQNYDVDGLHLDFIRWNEHTNSGNAPALEKRKAEQHLPDGIITEAQLRDLQENASGRYLYDVQHPFSGGVPAGFSSWADWWRATVTEFVQALHDSIQAVKPWVRLSPAALGRYNWGGWQGFNVVYQDAALWLNEGYIDQLIGMHYHWDQPEEFRSVLVSGCPECWNQFILPAIQAGRLYTVGLFSDSFSDNNIFGRHKPIIEEVRKIFWVDGFQFFSYASWRDRKYWDEAAEQFFFSKAKIRATGLLDATPPDAPTVMLNQLDSLRYQISVTPTNPVEDNYWFAIYRSEDGQLDVDTDAIIDIHFGNGNYAFVDSVTGLQDFNGIYTYYATAFDRFWNESLLSNDAQSDSIPSFAPQVVSTSPAEGDTIPVNSDIEIDFSKAIDLTNAEAAISIVPAAPIQEIIWSADAKSVTIRFAGNLAFATDYTVTVTPQLVDVNGKAIDGNGDGIQGDAFELHFTTLGEDVAGPQIVSSYPDLLNAQQDFGFDEVITVQFDELVDAATVGQSSLGFTQGTSDVAFDFYVSTVNNQSVLSIQPLQPLEPGQDYSVTLSTAITDTAGNPLPADVALDFRTSDVRYSENILIDGFLSVVNWFQPSGSGSTVGIVVPNTSFTMSTENFLPASSARQKVSPMLAYEWDESASEFLLREFLSDGAPRAVEFDTSFTLQCYVFGDGSGNKFRFAIDDNLPVEAAENHEVSQWITLDWVGWRIVEWKLSDLTQTGVWIGDGVPEGVLRLDSFQLTHETGAAVSGKVFFDNLRIVKKTTQPVSVAQHKGTIPTSFRLKQNYPNPFNPQTTIAFDLPRSGHVVLKVYDLLGREVATLLDAPLAAGSYKIPFDASDFSSGIYVYRLEANGRRLSRRMLFLK